MTWNTMPKNPKKVSVYFLFIELNITGPELWLSDDSQNYSFS